MANLLHKGYPQLARLQPEEFACRIAPLKERLRELPPGGEEGRIHFVIVVTSALVAAHDSVPMVELGRKTGFTGMEPADLEGFTAVDVELPPEPVYLLIDIDTGGGTLNVTPDEAIKTIVHEGRSPLTIEEGVALVTQYPDVLRTKNCFSMLGSRCGDRRVTAMWISRGRPRLGWCWAGAPHTWLGSASCGRRVGAELADRTISL